MSNISFTTPDGKPFSLTPEQIAAIRVDLTAPAPASSVIIMTTLGEIKSDVKKLMSISQDVEELKTFRTRVKTVAMTIVTLGGIIGWHTFTKGGPT